MTSSFPFSDFEQGSLFLKLTIAGEESHSSGSSRGENVVFLCVGIVLRVGVLSHCKDRGLSGIWRHCVCSGGDCQDPILCFLADFCGNPGYAPHAPRGPLEVEGLLVKLPAHKLKQENLENEKYQNWDGIFVLAMK